MLRYSAMYECFNARRSAAENAGVNTRGEVILLLLCYIGVDMIQFYDIDEAYASYLRNFDHQVPRIAYNTNNKFACGVVLCINGCNYFAPISSQTAKQRTNILIRDKDGNAISSIKFSYMIPAPSSTVKRKDFSAIRKIDPLYADLLQEEYAFCKKHEQDIRTKAMSVYKIGCNDNHPLNYACCKFPLLEEKCKAYLQPSETK